MKERYGIEYKNAILELGRTYKLAEMLMLVLAGRTYKLFEGTKAAGYIAAAFNKLEKAKEEAEIAAWKYCDFIIEKSVFNGSSEYIDAIEKLNNCTTEEEVDICFKKIEEDIFK